MQAILNCTPSRKFYTAEDLFKLPERDDGRWYELIRGELALNEPHPGVGHGRIEARLVARLSFYVEPRNLGEIICGDAGHTLERNLDTVLCPDISFIKTERYPYGIIKGYFEGAPDLAIEIRSPGQTVKSQIRKVQIYLRTGTPLVWLINPIKHNAIIFRADGTSTTIERDDSLSGEEIIPGFSCKLADIL